MLFHMLGYALDCFALYSGSHPFRLITRRLVRHLIYVAVRTGQVTAAVYLQDELLKGNRLVSALPDGRYAGVRQRPGSRMPGHANQPARSRGSVCCPRQACTSNTSARWVTNAVWSGEADRRCRASPRPIHASGTGSAESAIR